MKAKCLELGIGVDVLKISSAISHAKNHCPTVLS